MTRREMARIALQTGICKAAKYSHAPFQLDQRYVRGGITYSSAIFRPPFQYPQSLGELCLEIEADKIRWYAKRSQFITSYEYELTRHRFRAAMYHRERP